MQPRQNQPFVMLSVGMAAKQVEIWYRENINGFKNENCLGRIWSEGFAFSSDECLLCEIVPLRTARTWNRPRS